MGMASDGEEALQKALELAPDVVVLDVRMPKMDGIEAAHRIISRYPKTAIVIISAYDELIFVTELMKGGPERKAYLLKNSLDDIGELIRVVEAVTNDQTVLDRGIVQKITRLYVRQSRSLLSQLDNVEQRVLELMAEGYDDSYIARTLHIEEERMREYMSSIYTKLGISEEDTRDRSVQAVLAFVNQSTSVPYDLEGQASG